MQYRVLKPFQGDRPYKTGEVVSLEGRNLDRLVDQRYLEPLPTAPQERGISGRKAKD